MVLLEISTDPAVWTEIPCEWADPSDVGVWVDSTTALLVSMQTGETEPPELPILLTELARLADGSAVDAYLACIPDGDAYAGTVQVEVLEAENEFDDVIDFLARMDEERFVREPDIADISSATLGAGKRIVRFLETDDGLRSIYVSVRHVWRSGGADVSVVFDSYDLPVAAVLGQLVEELADGIAIRSDSGENAR